MSPCSVAYIILNCEHMDALHGDHSAVRLVHAVAFNVGIGYLPVHLEVDTVTAWDLRLPAEGELSVCYFGL